MKLVLIAGFDCVICNVESYCVCGCMCVCVCVGGGGPLSSELILTESTFYMYIYVHVCSNKPLLFSILPPSLLPPSR